MPILGVAIVFAVRSAESGLNEQRPASVFGGVSSGLTWNTLNKGYQLVLWLWRAFVGKYFY